MKRKVAALLISGICLTNSFAAYGAAVSDDALLQLLDKVPKYDKKDLVLGTLEEGFKDDEGIDILKSVFDSSIFENEMKKLKEKGVSTSDLNKSLDSLKGWSKDARMQLLDYVENNQMEKAAALINNNGVEQIPSSGGGGGGGGGATPVTTPAVSQPQIPGAIQVPELSTSPTISFKDIEGHWAKASIERMASLGLTSGISADDFGPNVKVTRSHMVAFIVKMLNLDLKGEGEVPFKDVNADAWDYDFIKVAYANKLVSGVSANAFAPGKEITREQMIVMIMNAMNYAKQNPQDTNTINLESFSDSTALSDWARVPMEKAIRLGLIQGKGNSTLDPKGLATRAEAIVILEKIYSLIYNQN